MRIGLIDVDGHNFPNLSLMRISAYHYARSARHKPHGDFGTVYCLTIFNSTIEQDLYRIYTLRDLGFKPYVMVYNKPSAPKQIKALQRWCNNVTIFRQCKRFEDYTG